jgi:2-oxoisovalerate dehydrogenase E2 component (dihydrolipoyl transacylase)
VQILMPQLGESVSEGTVDRWLKKVGDRVKKYEPLLEVVTDKVNAEVPSTASGVLRAILVPEGQTVAVGTPIAVIEAEGEGEADAAPAGAPAEAAPAAPAPAAEVGSRYSPAVRRLAAEHNVDLSQVKGTGSGGRVTREDVLAFVAARASGAAAIATPAEPAAEEEPSGVLFAPRPLRTPSAAAPAAPAAAPTPTPAPAAGGDSVLPLTTMRRTIAERMSASKRDIPHAWLMTEADVTGLDRLRAAVQEEFRRREGFELTYLPFFIKAAVAAIHAHPHINAQWSDEGIVLRREIAPGIAVALEDGLIVPVLRGADGLSIAGIARAVRDLVVRARSGRLTPADVQGGTITLNNTGAFGSLASMPIIPPGQAAIVTLEAVVRRPAVVGEGIAIRAFVNLCCSFDHRVLDGLTVGRFMKALREGLEAFQPGDAIY